MPYRVELSRQAEKQLDRIPDRYAERIWSAILRLKEEPVPRESRKLRGPAVSWRLRVGEYRVLYSVFRKDNLIVVDSIRRRTTTTYGDQ